MDVAIFHWSMRHAVRKHHHDLPHLSDLLTSQDCSKEDLMNVSIVRCYAQSFVKAFANAEINFGTKFCNDKDIEQFVTGSMNKTVCSFRKVGEMKENILGTNCQWCSKALRDPPLPPPSPSPLFPSPARPPVVKWPPNPARGSGRAL